MGKVPDEQFIDKVYGPEYPGDDKNNNAVVIIPADHHGVNAQYEVKYARIAVFHNFLGVYGTIINGC